MPRAVRRWKVVFPPVACPAPRGRERTMTAKTTEPAARLTDAQVAEVLALTEDADSVELKMTVPDSDRRAAVLALGMDPLDAQIRQVYFFDTPDLVLNQARCRRPEPPGPGAWRTTRWSSASRRTRRRARPSEGLPTTWEWRSTPCPGASSAPHPMKATLGSKAVKQVAAGERAHPQAVLQGAAGLLPRPRPRRRRARRPDPARPDHGPQAQAPPPELRMRLVAELWLYPDGSRILELSVECPRPRPSRPRRS